MSAFVYQQGKGETRIAVCLVGGSLTRVPLGFWLDVISVSHSLSIYPLSLPSICLSTLMCVMSFCLSCEVIYSPTDPSHTVQLLSLSLILRGSLLSQALFSHRGPMMEGDLESERYEGSDGPAWTAGETEDLCSRPSLFGVQECIPAVSRAGRGGCREE